MTRRLVCTFRAADLLLGIPIEHIVEVVAEQAVTPVPLAHPDVVGLMNLRGQVLTVIDARRRLQLGERVGAGAVVIVRTGDEMVALLVDRPDEVVELDDRRFEPVPDVVAPAIRDLAVAAIPIGSELLLVLDVEPTLAVTS